MPGPDPGERSPEHTPHPWNRGFTWRDHAVDALQALDPDQVRQFDEQGFVVIPDLVDAATIATLTTAIDDIEAGLEAFLETQDSGRIFIAEAGAITFAPHLVTQLPEAAALARCAPLAGLCCDLVGPEVRLYWDQAVYKKPAKPRRFPFHQDNGYTYVEPQQYLTVWLALTDATEENGCPWVVPGLHRHGTLRHTYVEPLGWECFEDHPEKVPAPVSAGGAVVFSSLTPHLTGPNISDGVRKAYILQYAPDGAEILEGDPAVGPPTARLACDDPDRQFLVAL